jgi:hypothetical protein
MGEKWLRIVLRESSLSLATRAVNLEWFARSTSRRRRKRQ